MDEWAGEARAALSIVHPWDPWHQGIGGFDTALDGILRYAPAEWGIEVIGLSTDSRVRPARRWIDTEFAGRRIRFFPAFHDPEPDRVRFLPLSFRFTAACRATGVRATGRIVQFHRFEAGFGLPRLADQRWVLFLHNHPAEARSSMSDMRWKRLGILHDLLLENRLARADAIAAVDPRTPDWIRSRLASGSRPVIWLREWADRNVFSPAAPDKRRQERDELRRSLHAGVEAKIVLFAGRFESQKDPLLLVRALHRLALERDEVRLLLVGKVRLRGRLIRLARAIGIEDHVHFADPVERRRMARYYRAADVVACTSSYEGGPRYVFEALACGTPVVSFDVGQVRSALEGGPAAGRLVETRTVDAFSRALREVFARPHDAESIRRCAAAVEQFRPEISLRPVFDLYQSWLAPVFSD